MAISARVYEPKVPMENSVKERLTKYLSFKNVKSINFCSAIGVSTGFISSMRKSIQPGKLYTIAVNYPDLDIGWLVTGVGSMIREHSIENVNESNLISVEKEEIVSIVRKFQDQIELKDQEIADLKKRIAELKTENLIRK